MSSRIRKALRAPFKRSARSRGGSVHVLETMIVGIMVVGAVVAVSTMNSPVSQTEGFKTTQERLVQDALDSLAGLPSLDESEARFDSRLEEYVLKAVAGEKGPLMEYLNRSLPAGSQYNVFMDTGFGRPVNVIDGGTPAGESLTGARSFVPKLSYVFMVPEFQRYQDDFHMNVLAIPMHNSILQKDEGIPVELAVTFTNGDGITFTQYAYGETALRFNDPENRSWASTSIYSPTPGGKPSYYVDASDAPLYGGADLEVSLDGVSYSFGDAYNITVPLVVEESAGHPIPRGAQISVEFPRGWVFDQKKRDWLESELSDWNEFDWGGSDGKGWTISARLKDPVKDGKAYFNITGNYVMILDTSYPYFHPVTAWMGSGTQGKSTILIETPQAVDAGGFRRETFLSLAKPMIADERATWGASFANLGLMGTESEGDPHGGAVTIDRIELRQPAGYPLMKNVTHLDGWVGGEWSADPDDPAHYIWEPTGSASVPTGEGAWLSMDVVGGPTRDNHYRNHDYQNVSFNFSPQNTTDPDATGNWTHTQRAHHMIREYVYRHLVPPKEDSAWTGWPDEADEYWFGAMARQQNRYAPGNSSFEVDTDAVLSQTFGDYQGDHVFSRINLVDTDGSKTRTFEIGDRVHVKNDFEAIFGRLTSGDLSVEIDGEEEQVTVDNIRIKTSVFTPERAWRGIPTETFEETASADVTTGNFNWLLATDVIDNGVLDVIAVDSAGLVYALDGRDGSKLWQLGTGKDVRQAELADVTADGRMELVLGGADNKLRAYQLALDMSEDDRHLWTLDVDPSVLNLGLDDVDPFHITKILDISNGPGTLGGPVIAVAVASKTSGAHVSLVSTDKDAGGDYTASVAATRVSDNKGDSNTVIQGLVRAKGADGDYLGIASMNRTVTMVSLPDFKLHWITKIPQRAFEVTAADLTDDGWEDLVVNAASLYEEEPDPQVVKDVVRAGTEVYVLPGRTGHFGPATREVDSLSVSTSSRGAGVLSNGWGVAVGDHSEVLQDHSGLYSPLVHVPAVDSCSLEDETDLVSFDDQEWQPLDVVAWLESQAWSGVHVAQTGDGELLQIISRDGSILKVVDSCGNGRLLWDDVHVSDLEDPSFMALHAYDPDDSGGSMHRMNESGLIQGWTGSSWFDAADVCTMTELAGCPGGVTVNRWAVEEDAEGRPVRFWAALDLQDENDAEASEAHLVSVDVDDLATAAGAPADAVWAHHYQSATQTLTALRAGSGGELYFGGVRDDLAAFLKHRASGGAPFEDQVLFSSNSTVEHGGMLLDVIVEGDQAWAIDQRGNVWRHASEDTWVPFPSWAPQSNSGRLAADPSGTVWAFYEDFVHMPLRSYADKAEVYLPQIPLGTTLDAGETVWLDVASEEAHRFMDGSDDAVTKVKWYARGVGGDQSWWPLISGGLSVGPMGIAELDHQGLVYTTAKTSAVQLKAVLETRTLITSELVDGVAVQDIAQDPGASPLLRSADVDVLEHQYGPQYAQASFIATDMEPDADAQYVDTLDGYVLADAAPAWHYLGGMNIDVQLSSVISRNNRQIGTGTSLTSDAQGTDVAIADRGDSRFYWWIVDGATGLPLRPSAGQVGATGSQNILYKLLVGDLTGEGNDDVALVGDFGDNAPGAVGTDKTYQALVWDSDREAFSTMESDENHIVPSAILTGPHQGHQTLTMAVPSLSFYLFLDKLNAEGENPDFIASFYGPTYTESTESYKTPEIRWGSNPLTAQGFTTFSYHIPRNAMFGTSIVMSEMTFDLSAKGSTVTQTARILDWFDILPPARTKSVPPVYTVEVVAWFDEGQLQRKSGGSATLGDLDGSVQDGSSGGLNVEPDKPGGIS